MNKSVAITGATGMIGGLVLRECLSRDDVGSVTTIGRRPTRMADDKLTDVSHQDFEDLTNVAKQLERIDVAFFCLGAYTGQVPDDLFRRITVDYVVEFARALHSSSPRAAVCLLSGQGADHSEQSKMAFARYKGAAEKAVINQGFPEVSIFRPGYIYPVEPRQEPNRTYRIFRTLYPIVGKLVPNVGVTSVALAQAMVFAGVTGLGRADGLILENRDIRELAAELT